MSSQLAYTKLQDPVSNKFVLKEPGFLKAEILHRDEKTSIETYD